MSLNFIDIGIIILVFLSTMIGLFRGFVKEALSLMTWLAAFAFSIYYAEPIATFLPIPVESETMRIGISFAAIFLLTLMAGSMVSYMIARLVNSVGLGIVDHILGGGFGFLRGALIVSLLVILLQMGPFPRQDWWQHSQLMPIFEDSSSWLKNLLPKAEGVFQNLSNQVQTERL